MPYVFAPLRRPITPVVVQSEQAVEALLDGLMALELLGEGLVDEDWLSGEDAEVSVDEPARLEAALIRYRLVRPQGVADAGAAGLDPRMLSVLDEFFELLGETVGQGLVISHTT